MTAVDAAAAAEGLVLLRAENKTGFKNVGRSTCATKLSLVVWHEGRTETWAAS